jgi:hypothetical protein
MANTARTMVPAAVTSAMPKNVIGAGYAFSEARGPAVRLATVASEARRSSLLVVRQAFVLNTPREGSSQGEAKSHNEQILKGSGPPRETGPRLRLGQLERLT